MIVTIYEFVVPSPAVTTMEMALISSLVKSIGADGTPEVAGKPSIVNVAVESCTVAVTVVLVVVFGAVTS